MIIVYISIALIVCITLWTISFFLPISSNTGLLGSAKFSRGSLRRNPDELVVEWPYGLSTKDGLVHSCIIGPSGVGKSQKVLIMSILADFTGSKFVLDVKGEITPQILPLARQKGMKVQVLDFANPKESACYNPLKRLTTEALQKSFCENLYDIANPRETDGIWKNLAVDLLFLVVNSLKYAPVKYQTLANLCLVLRGLTGRVGRSFVEKWGTDTSKRLYSAFFEMDERLRSNAHSSATSTISILEDETVQKITRSDDFSFDDIRNGSRPTLVIFRTPALSSRSFQATMSLFYGQFFQWLFSQPEESKYRVSFYCDEFTNSIRLPQADKVFSLCRSWNVRLHIVLQSIRSLRAVYGEDVAHIIFSNFHSYIVFGGCSDTTTQKFVCDNLLGISTLEEIKQVTGRSILHRKELLTPQELLQMKGGLFISKKKTQKINPKPLYRLSKRVLRKRFGLIKVNKKLQSIYNGAYTGSDAPEIEYLPCVVEDPLQVNISPPRTVNSGSIIESDHHEEIDDFDQKLKELLDDT